MYVPASCPNPITANVHLVLSSCSGTHAILLVVVLVLISQLCYSRGTVIPCYLIVAGSDSQALDLLSLHTAPKLALRRCVRYNEFPTRPKIVSWKEDLTHINTAVWWREQRGELTEKSETRHLQGEIHLKENLAPSFEFSQVAVKVRTVLSDLNQAD